MMASQPGADPLARFDRPLPHPEAPFHVRVQWIRTGVRLWVRIQALAELLTPVGDHRHRVEGLLICQESGARIRASNAEIIAASDSEWKAATMYCGRFMEAMRRELWGRCRARQPPDVIIIEAKLIAQRFDMPASDEQLAGLLRDIWIAAQSYKKRPVRHGGRG